MKRALLIVVVAACDWFPNVGGLASNSDAAAPDSSADVAAPAEAGRYCATVDAAFCADFDDLATPLMNDWSQKGAHEMTIGRDLDASVSPPASLAAALDVPSANDVAYGVVDELFAPDPTITSYTLTYDLRVDALANGNEVIVGQLAWNNSAHRAYVNLGSDGTVDIQEDWVAADGGTSSADLFALDKLTIGDPAFTHVTLIVMTSPPTLTLRFGSKTEIDAQPLNGADFSGATELDIGVAYLYGPVGAMSMHADNVVLSTLR